MADTTLVRIIERGCLEHRRFHPYCGICTDALSVLEPVIAVFGNPSSTPIPGVTQPFRFHASSRHACLYGSCPSAPRADLRQEFVAIHHDCFRIFRQRCQTADALSRLWVLAAWKSPWRNAEPIRLSKPLVNSPALREILESTGLPPFHTFPQEIVEMIRQRSQHAPLWRLLDVYRLAAHISSTAPEPLVTIPLCNIYSWERNGVLQEVNASRPAPPTLRLTLDSGGINRIERLVDRPQYAGERTSQAAFIVLQQDSFSKMEVQIKDGCLRLVPLRHSMPRVWNTPTPPLLLHCNFLSFGRGRDRGSQNLHAHGLDAATGLTFFMRGSQLYGFHVHRPGRASCAKDYFTETFPSHAQQIAWIYVPISRQDYLLLLGTRLSTNVRLASVRRCVAQSSWSIVIRTKLAGDINLGGQCLDDIIRDTNFCSSVPSALIYTESEYGDGPGILGIYCGEPPSDSIPTPPEAVQFQLPVPSPWADNVQDCFSWAPLSGVSSTVVFKSERTGICRGILFSYHNGAERAVGQCRLHVDPTEKVKQPDRLWFQRGDKSSSYPGAYQNARLKFKQAHQSTVEDEGGECYPMQGLIRFWINDEAAKNRVLVESSYPVSDLLPATGE